MEYRPMSSEDRDLELAILARRLLHAQGYYTELKVPIFLPMYTPTFKLGSASDVDVLGVRFDPDLAPSIAIAEAKSGEEKALEELLKLRAAATYIQATKMYFVKTRIHGNAREIGRQLGIASLNKAEVLQILNGLGVDNKDASPTELASYKQQKGWLATMRKTRASQRIANYLESDFWSRTYWENIHNLIYLLKEFVDRNQASPPDWAEFVILRTVSILSISILHLSRQIVMTSFGDIQGGVSTFIWGGASARRQKERLRDEIMKAIPAQGGRLSIPSEPPFLNDLKELVAYLLISPCQAAKIPLIFQEALEVVSITGGKFVATMQPLTADPVSLKLAKDTLQFAVKSSGMTKPIGSLPHEFIAL